ncbi:MAG TPA: ATP synthase F0 subunit B [Caldithrix abyssi]|uniref:ATP synthase subunit b n=1 Tax=Caldithrix abyssi TaxID=187145 RepID=A0A7V5PNJ1_CALAY|nr:ATP synthase F0 subunit B [Caldithrix abyssi]
MLNIDPGMMIWTWITFFIVLFILSKIALKPIMEAIESREKSIREDLETAHRQREEAESLLEKHRQLIAGAEQEAQKLIKESQQLAEKARQEIIEGARQESSRLIEKARQEIEHEKESALASLRAEVADLAIGAAEKVILQSLDEEKQKKVVDEYIKSMPKSIKN